MIINQEPTIELWQQEPGIKGLMKHIERCGRVSYKSEGSITEYSYVEFMERMQKLGHGTVLEHGTVYLAVDDTSSDQTSLLSKYKENKYSKCNCFTEIITGTQTASIFITTNYRVLLQGYYWTWEEAVKNGYDKNWLNDLKYMVEPDSRFEKRISIHIITDRGVSAEANRHRVNTVTERSTRYCDYSNEKKFNGQVCATYFFGYALGRVWIEGLRTDQLCIGNVPVSQALSAVLIIASVVLYVYCKKKAAAVPVTEGAKAETEQKEE